MADHQAAVCEVEENVTNPEESYLTLYSTGDRLIISVVYPCFMVLGIITNGAFCIVICRVPRMRTITNLYLVNLAVADTTFLIVSVSEKLSRIMTSPVASDKTYGLAGCILVPVIVNCSYFASIFIVTLVSAEKFYAVCWPLQHRVLSTKERTIKLLIGAWVLSLTLSCGLIPGRAHLHIICVHWPADYTDMILPPVITLCKPANHWTWFQHISNFSQAVPFFIAAAANMVMYSKIMKTMHGRVNGQGGLTEMNNDRMVEVRNQVAAMLVANGLIFFICQMLFQCVSIALAFRHLRTPPILTVDQVDKVLLVARILSYLNSVVNSIVYNIFSSRYRSAFRETFCWWKAHRVHPRAIVGHTDQNLSNQGGQRNSTNHSTGTHDTVCVEVGGCQQISLNQPQGQQK